MRPPPTPCAVIDLDILERNAATMRERARRLGVTLRPHVKTHKTVPIARIQLAAETGPITVSTLAEARHFIEAGFRDLTWALPLPPPRAEEAMALARRVDHLGLLVDSEEAAGALSAAARITGLRAAVWLKVDCGYHRVGVDPDAAESLALARRLFEDPHLDFQGLLTHAGHSYHARGPTELRAVAVAERDAIVGFAERLRAAGLPVPGVSLGSTPTLSVAADLAGVTEIRPGNYIFHDLSQVCIGSCTVQDVALTVHATVIGCYPAARRLVLDAGALALSKDLCADAPGYGVLQSPNGAETWEDLHLVALSQEHGLVACDSEEAARRLPVGSRVRLLPNHSCLVAALHPTLYATRRGVVEDVYTPARGW